MIYVSWFSVCRFKLSLHDLRKEFWNRKNDAKNLGWIWKL